MYILRIFGNQSYFRKGQCKKYIQLLHFKFRGKKMCSSGLKSALNVCALKKCLGSVNLNAFRNKFRIFEIKDKLKIFKRILDKKM